MSFGSEDDSNQVKKPNKQKVGLKIMAMGFNNQSQGAFRAVEMTATTNGSETKQQLSANLALFRMNMRS